MSNPSACLFASFVALVMLLFPAAPDLVLVREGKKTPLRPEEEFMLNRQYPDAAVPLAAYRLGMAQALQSMYLRGGQPGFNEPWTLEGPGNIGARINTVAVHPTDDNTVYVGFSRGGVWKTTDGGQQWVPIFDDQLFGTIAHITLAPNDPNTVYVATGDPNIGGYYYIGDGLYRSTDGGATWTHLGLSDQRILSKVLIDPNDPNRLYIGAMGNPSARDQSRGVYRSLDGGQTWSQRLFVDEDAGIIDLVMDPFDPQTLYAASWNRFRTTYESYVDGDDARIWKTTDGGQTWTMLQGGLPMTDLGRIGLAISARTPGVLYAMYLDTDDQLYEIFKTTDGGANWTVVPTETNGLPPDALGGFGWYFGKLRIGPNSDDELHLLGVDLYSTYDGGNTWSMTTPPWWTYEVHSDKHDLVWTPSGQMLLATDGGLYRSADNGQTWTDAENIPTTQFYRVAHNPHRPLDYYGGAQDNGSTGGNASDPNGWPRIFGGDGFQMAFRPDDPNIWYAETQNGNLMASPDGGQFFYPANDGFWSQERKSWDMPYFVSVHDPNVLLAGGQAVYRSTAGAFPYWEPISPTLTDSVRFRRGGHVISALSQSPLDAGILYAGTSDGNLWRSLDGGATWDSLHQNGLPNRYVSSVHASPHTPGTVFATYTGYRENDYQPHVFRSLDHGDTWTDIGAGLPQVSVNDLLVLPYYADSALFVGTDAGVYGSTNGGTTWERLGSNLPLVATFDLGFNPTTLRLVAGTHARSIQTYPLEAIFPDLSVLTGAPPATPNGAALLQLWPQPAADQLYCAFSASEDQPAELTIFDLGGRAVRQQTVPGAARSETSLDIADLPAGLYFLRIVCGPARQCAKFIKR
jgi:photosystem II stability/assembly factor-like uncharacterized protein